MCLVCSIAYSATAATLALTSAPSISTRATSCDQASTICNDESSSPLAASLQALSKPQFATPEWMKPKPVRNSKVVAVTYNVETRGAITANLDEFKQQAQQTYNDTRGWARMGVTFTQVASGGSFTLVLSEANQLPSFSSGCSADYSCRAGRYVVINQDRWLGATTSWNNAGGTLRDYRHMVINHETGHWLGHGHESCGGSGQQAPVMQQQSIDLQGCSFNPWPLDSELTSSALGI